jgi:predicted RNA-binding Zn-ribbon protein involved in translation (DUF1610 family)
MRDCFLCGTTAPSEIHDYGMRYRFKCANCGEYQITKDAMTFLIADKSTLKKIVANGQESNTDETILCITTKNIKAERR